MKKNYKILLLLIISTIYTSLSFGSDTDNKLLNVDTEYSNIEFTLNKDIIKTLEKYVQLNTETTIEINKVNGDQKIVITLKSANDLIEEGYNINLDDIKSNNEWRNTPRFQNTNLKFITYITRDGKLNDISKF